ncbi:MAG TPA: hypothetical protein VGQ83_00605 [Polyangia bacterium]|jgi:hypothetical protein
MWLRFARRTSTTDAATGIVVVEGRVVADRTLSIPGSRSRPVYHDTSFESYRTVAGGRGRAAWVVDRKDEQVVPFVLEDDAGRILVSAEREQVVVKGGRREIGSTGRNATGRFLSRMILPGDVVRVRGEVFEPRRAAAPRGLRATRDRPLEILFRREGAPPEADEQPAAPPPERRGKRKQR